MDTITDRTVTGIQIRQGDVVQVFPAGLSPVYAINDFAVVSTGDDDDLYWNDDLPQGDYILLRFDDGKPWALFGHRQGCCEDVHLSEWCGDWGDLIGQHIEAEERTSPIQDPEDDEADPLGNWTFYTFRSLAGSITATWRGTSHYYSTRVDLLMVELRW